MFDNLDLGRALTDGLSAVAVLVPKLLAFGAILLLGWIIALVLKKICNGALERVGFNRAADRGGIRQMLARGNHDASGIVARLVFCAVLLVALQMAFGVWGPNPISDLIKGVVAWLPKAAVAVVMVVVAAAIARAVRDIIGTALGAVSYGGVLAAVTSYAVLGLGVIAALNEVGVAMTVTMPVLITVLATAGGILVVGAGGGLIRPMQQRWERWLSRAEAHSTEIAEHARAYAAGRNDTSTRYIRTTMPEATTRGAATTGSTMHRNTYGGWPSNDDTIEQPVASEPSQHEPSQHEPSQHESGHRV